MKMETGLGTASCTQGFQIYSQEEVSPCLLGVLSCSVGYVSLLKTQRSNSGKSFLPCRSGDKG